MKKMYLLVNLIAGKAKISQNLANIIDQFVISGYDVTVHTTQSSNDAITAGKHACDENFDALVVAGGDGTLSQCLQGIMQSENHIPVGYIPAGSTNDFAKSLGIPADVNGAVRCITQGRPVLCDVGGFNGGFFSYVAAFGAFTNITYETSQRAKNNFGHAAYIARGAAQLNSIKSKRLLIESEGSALEDSFIYGMVSNAASIAGMITMKEFLLDDGLFEVTLIRSPKSDTELGLTAFSLLRNDMSDKNIVFFRTNELKITNLDDEPFTWTRDGEYGGAEVVNEICCHKQAVPFFTLKY